MTKVRLNRSQVIKKGTRLFQFILHWGNTSCRLFRNEQSTVLTRGRRRQRQCKGLCILPEKLWPNSITTVQLWTTPERTHT